MANQKQELPVVAMFVNGSGQNVQSLERIFYRCFLPSFSSFGWGVSEEKIKMWKVNGRRMPSDGKTSLCLWQGELKNDLQNTTQKTKDRATWTSLKTGFYLRRSGSISSSCSLVAPVVLQTRWFGSNWASDVRKRLKC